jgi:3-phosphoshikimate 1-carboxyvinyltransferase
VKESDRIATTAAMLRAYGADVEERPDGLRISGRASLRGAKTRSQGDHRLAMAAAVAALFAAGESEVDDGDVVAVSYPRFWRDLAAITGVQSLA